MTGIPYLEALAHYQSAKSRDLKKLDMTKDELLRAFHPDYREDSLISLRVGPNQGDQCHRQLAELLQSDARIDEADLAGATIVKTDVLVIGGGGD